MIRLFLRGKEGVRAVEIATKNRGFMIVREKNRLRAVISSRVRTGDRTD